MITWLAIIALEIVRNWYVIERKKQTPDYHTSVIFRFLALLVVNALVAPNPFFWAFQVFSFWVLFDIGLNLVRRKPLFYLGENSYIDRTSNKSPITVWLAKIFFFIASTVATVAVGAQKGYGLLN